MTQSLGFDHAILVVNDLKQAQKDFESLGFTVFYGGKHADGKTENCLIVFQDSTYIELIGLVDPSALNNPEGMHAQLFGPGEGWSGYALLSHDLDTDVKRMRERGLAIDGPADNSRARPDGELVAWRAATLTSTMTPFFIQDRTPRTMRVADDERNQHANGVTSIARVVIAVPDIETAVEQYGKILDQSSTPSTLTLPDAITRDFPDTTPVLTLAAPTSPELPLDNQLKARGESVYMIQLQTTQQAKSLDIQLTHSAQLQLVNE